MVAVQVGEHLRHLRPEHAQQRQLGALEHGDLGAGGAGGRGGLQADPAPADDHDPGAGAERGLEAVAVVEGAQVVHAVRGRRRAPAAGAGWRRWRAAACRSAAGRRRRCTSSWARRSSAVTVVPSRRSTWCSAYQLGGCTKTRVAARRCPAGSPWTAVAARRAGAVRPRAGRCVRRSPRRAAPRRPWRRPGRRRRWRRWRVVAHAGSVRLRLRPRRRVWRRELVRPSVAASAAQDAWKVVRPSRSSVCDDVVVVDADVGERGHHRRPRRGSGRGRCRRGRRRGRPPPRRVASGIVFTTPRGDQLDDVAGVVDRPGPSPRWRPTGAAAAGHRPAASACQRSERRPRS